MRGAVVIALVAGCGFEASGNRAPGDASHDGIVVDGDANVGRWWDPAWMHRLPLTVRTGGVRPDKGYAGYTVRIEVPINELPGGALDGHDLRVIYDDGSAFHELPVHIAMDGTMRDLRFALPVDITDNTTWRDAALYYGNAAAPPPKDATGTAVYLWWDPATTNRLPEYTHGRMDQWLATGYADSWSFQTNAYAYDTGDDKQAGLRKMVAERDVYIEASWFHTACYPNNMQSGVCARGKIASGGPATEQSIDYYCTSRAQNPMCNDADQGIYDGDIVTEDNEILAYANAVDPIPLVPSQWRSQALAVFGVGPAQLRFWDANTAWTTLAMPPTSALLASGPALREHPDRGFAGVMTAQDGGKLRDIVIRRYTEPEPIVLRETVQQP